MKKIFKFVEQPHFHSTQRTQEFPFVVGIKSYINIVTGTFYLLQDTIYSLFPRGLPISNCGHIMLPSPALHVQPNTTFFILP